MSRLARLIAEWRTPAGADFARWERKNYWLRLAGYRIAPRGVAIGRGFRSIEGNESGITIDEFAAIGQNVHFWNFDAIHVGRYSMVAADVVVSNGWHDKHDLRPAAGPTTIGHGAWIGTAARIVGSVTVGDNAIVGAGSVVIHDIPPNSIVVGVPARVIGLRELPDRVWHLGENFFSPHDFEAAPKADPSS